MQVSTGQLVFCKSLDYAVIQQIRGTLLITSRLQRRIQEFIHTQHRNTTRSRRPSVVLQCKVWTNSRIHGIKQGVMNLSHAHMIFVKLWNVSAFLNSEMPLLSGLNYLINTVLLGGLGAARKVDGVRDRHCDVLPHYTSRWWRQTWDTCLYLTVVSQSEARVITEHGINSTSNAVHALSGHWIFAVITPRGKSNFVNT